MESANGYEGTAEDEGVYEDDEIPTAFPPQQLPAFPTVQPMNTPVSDVTAEPTAHVAGGSSSTAAEPTAQVAGGSSPAESDMADAMKVLARMMAGMLAEQSTGNNPAVRRTAQPSASTAPGSNNDFQLAREARDVAKELQHLKFPVYDGNIKSLRKYRKEVELCLSTCTEAAQQQAVPHLVQHASADFKQKWLRGKNDVKRYKGVDALKEFYAKLKEIAGVQQVDDLNDTLFYYIQHFKQSNSETIKEYVDREEQAWEDLQDSIRRMDNSDQEEISPIHDQLRGRLLLLHRSHSHARYYPMILKECEKTTKYALVREAMTNAYREIKSLKGNQSTFGPKTHKPTRSYAVFEEEEDSELWEDD